MHLKYHSPLAPEHREMRTIKQSEPVDAVFLAAAIFVGLAVAHWNMIEFALLPVHVYI
jgi:hypothetical protein